MALLQNIAFLSQYPLAQKGAILTQEKCFWNRNDRHMNVFTGPISQKSGMPSGYEAPYSWKWPMKAGGLSAFVSIGGTGALAPGSLAMGLACTAPSPKLKGIGTVSSASLSLLVQFLADLEGSGDITAASLAGSLKMSASLSGSGEVDISSMLAIIAWMQAALEGEGDAGGALRGEAWMSADISSSGDVLTAQSVAAAVWAAISAANNDSGSMGEKLNSAASAGDPWITELPGSYTDEQAGNIIGRKLLTLAKFLALKD